MNGSTISNYRVSQENEIADLDPILVIKYEDNDEVLLCKLSVCDVYWAADLKVSDHYVTYRHLLRDKEWNKDHERWIRRHKNYSSDRFGIIRSHRDETLSNNMGQAIGDFELLPRLFHFLDVGGKENERDPKERSNRLTIGIADHSQKKQLKAPPKKNRAT